MLTHAHRSVPASQSAEDDDKERSKECKAMMAELTAKAVRDTHARKAHAHASALRRRPSESRPRQVGYRSRCCRPRAPALQEADTKEMEAMLARVSAIEKQLAAEAEEDAAAMERAEAKQRAALAALDESYAQKVAAIKASMKHLKDLAKKYCA